MSISCAALLRGINVGRAKRVPMAELRALMTELGFGDVRTLLNSGNAVFSAPTGSLGQAASRIEQALADRLGFQVPTIVTTEADIARVVRENPFAEMADDHSRLLVMFVREPAALTALRPIVSTSRAARKEGGSSRLACGSRAAYIWCPDGILESPLPDEAARLLKSTVVTTRNWATTLRIHALMTHS